MTLSKLSITSDGFHRKFNVFRLRPVCFTAANLEIKKKRILREPDEQSISFNKGLLKSIRIGRRKNTHRIDARSSSEHYCGSAVVLSSRLSKINEPELQ